MTRLAEAVPARCAVYVVTVGGDGGAHVAPTAAVVEPDGTVVLADLGRRSRANLAAGSAATVVWSTGDPGDYTVIVDGSGVVDDDGGCVVRPTRAVLHRRGSDDHEGPDGSACAADCVELAIG